MKAEVVLFFINHMLKGLSRRQPHKEREMSTIENKFPFEIKSIKTVAY